MAFLRNQRGFTLISMLMTLIIIFMSLPLLVHVLKLTAFSTNYDEISMQQFFFFLRDEVIMATDYQVEENKLTLVSPDGGKTTFEKYQDVVVRRIDGKGHEVFVRNIDEIIFRLQSYGIKTTITSLQGGHYEKTIFFYN